MFDLRMIGVFFEEDRAYEYKPKGGKKNIAY